MTIKFPRRKLNDDGEWIIETPPVDPVAARQHSIEYWRQILTSKYPDGRPGSTPDAREQARQKLEELGEPVSN